MKQTLKQNFQSIEHKKVWIDSMIGMTIGFLATLVVGTIIGLLGMGQTGPWHDWIESIKGALTYITPFGIGIGVGYKTKLNPIQMLALAISVQISAHSLFAPSYSSTNGFDWIGEFGMSTKFLPGDVFSAWISSMIVFYILKLFLTSTVPIVAILIPFAGAMIGIANAMYLTYATSTILTIAKYIIDISINDNYILAIILAPIIGVIMGLALSFPTSSVAISVALSLHGNAAVAAIGGTSAQMISFGIMTYLSNKSISKALTVGFGSSMVQMRNFVAHPKILIIPILASGIAALIGVTATHDLSFVSNPSVAPGMGTSALYGQIYTLQLNGWTNIQAWMNVIFIQLLFPAILTLSLYPFLIKTSIIKYEFLRI